MQSIRHSCRPVLCTAKPSRPSTLQAARYTIQPRTRRKPLEQHPLAIAFTVTVLGSLSYGLYRLVAPYFAWPNPIRDELKRGLFCETKKEWGQAEAHYRLAWEASRALKDELGHEALLRTTGIAAHLGGLLERRAKRKEAAEVYSVALADVRADADASPREQMRGVALAVRRAELTDDLPLMEWAAAELLRVATLDQEEGTGPQMGRLLLPKWVQATEVGAVFERLGHMYLGVDRNSLAVPAFLQALSAMTPNQMDFETRCHAATLMNAIASASVSQSDSAKAWALKSLETARAAIGDAKRANKRRSTGECRDCEVAALHNLGCLLEGEGDRKQAMPLYQEALQLARKSEMGEGIKLNQNALDRMHSVPL